MQEIQILLHVNNKGTVQLAYLRNLISTFVMGSLDSIIAELAT